MKRRTKVTAWVFFFLWGGEIINLWIDPQGPAHLRALTGICCAVMAMNWMFVLLKQQWARNSTLIAQFVCAAGVLTSVALDGGRTYQLWLSLALTWAALVAWQAFVLLTENPREWVKG